MIIGTVSSLKN